MKVDLNKPLLDLEGNAVSGEGAAPLGKILATLMMQSNKGNPVKMYGWAQCLFSGKEIDIDKGDKKVLEDFIRDSETVTNLAKAQILEVFYAIKE